MWTRFYTLTKLQGSQTSLPDISFVSEFYTLTKLQGSQTQEGRASEAMLFYTLTKLQGSQTSNCHHRTYILGSIITLLTFILQSNTCLCL